MRKRSPIVTFLCFSELINHLSCKDLTTYFSLAIGSFARAYSGRRTEILASFRFEDDDENEDQVQLLLIVRMLKSVTVMA